MSKLLEELKKIKVTLPEGECFVPEWDRAIRLRGFTVAEGRKLRAGEAKNKDGQLADADSFAYKTIAHSIVDGEERPLASKDGVALIEGLSEATCGRLIRAINRLAGGDGTEKNSEATGNGAVSSDLPASSDAQSLN